MIESIRSNRIYFTRYLFITIGIVGSILLYDILLHELAHGLGVSATSINYGVIQQPITDIKQLKPRLCQNQSTICEGSFCIPGVKKCVCDLRMPVQISRFCLRQVDIETKCFATNQCNHTVKDAVCIDMNSRTVLDAETSKFKLEQWQQLNELKKSSQSTLSKDAPAASQQINKNQEIIRSKNVAFLLENKLQKLRAYAQDSLIPSSARNSPYEINYDTPELLHQNHTRRRTNSNDRTEFSTFLNLAGPQEGSRSPKIGDSSDSSLTISTALPQTTTLSESPITLSPTITPTSQTTTIIKYDESTREVAPTTTTYSDAINRKKITIKTTHWPPGVCSCPIGFMFDAMLRKCLALSLAESHCVVDTDCKQIVSSHCSISSRKCECDEPFVWDRQELACTRPKQSVRTEATISDGNERKETTSLMDNLIPPLVLAKLMPDYTMMLIIFVALVMICTLLILSYTVKCFSSNSSALMSPKNKKKKPNQNSMPTRSPYATLRRSDNKPGSQLSNFTQVTRGRILNYDFEQEGPRTDEDPSQSSARLASATLRPTKTDKSINDCPAKQYSATLRWAPKGHRHHNKEDRASIAIPIKNVKKEESIDDSPLELNDNISISHLESESDSSKIVIPDPPPTQQPPYMLKNPMRGQSSAIAAAAAAVANKRLQKKNLDQQQQQSNGRITSESPVFL